MEERDPHQLLNPLAKALADAGTPLTQKAIFVPSESSAAGLTPFTGARDNTWQAGLAPSLFNRYTPRTLARARLGLGLGLAFGLPSPTPNQVHAAHARARRARPARARAGAAAAPHRRGPPLHRG